MSIFAIDIKINSLNDFKNKLHSLSDSVQNISLDQVEFETILENFDNSILAYATRLEEISKISLTSDHFKELNQAEQSFRRKLKNVSEVFLLIHEKYNSEFKPSFVAFQKEFYPQIVEMRSQLDAFEVSINDEFRYEYEDNLAELKLYQEKLEKSGSSRNFIPLALIEAKQKCEELSIKTKKSHILYTENLDNLVERYNTENKPTIDRLHYILERRYKINTDAIKGVFCLLFKKFGRVLSDLSSFKKWLKQEYDPEADICEFISAWTDAPESKDKPMHESLMPIDLKASCDKISKTTFESTDLMIDFSSQLKELQANFMDENVIELSERPCVGNSKINNLILAFKDINNYHSNNFNENIGKLSQITKEAKKFLDKIETLREANSEALQESEETPQEEKGGDSPAMKNFKGFDNNFFDALNNTKCSFSVGNMVFDNTKKTTASIFKDLSKRLETDELNKKAFLRTMEVFFLHLPVWIRNYIIELNEELIQLMNNNKGVLQVIVSWVENCCLAHFIPTIHEKLPKLQMIEKMMSNREPVESAKPTTEEETVSDTKSYKGIDEKVYERFIGKEEAEKHKGDDSKNNINFFSFLLENMDADSVEDVLDIALDKDATRPTHKMVIDEMHTIVVKDLDEIEILSLSLDNFKQIRISSASKHRYNRVIHMSNKRGETKVFYHFNKDDPHQFKNILTRLYKDSLVRQKISNGIVSLPVTVITTNKKGKQTFKKVKLSMNTYDPKVLKLNEIAYKVENQLLFASCMNKAICMEAKDSSRVTRKIIFDNYVNRDYVYNHLLSCREEAKSLHKDENDEINFWMGVAELDNDKFKMRIFAKWVELGHSAYIFVLYNCQKINENMLKPLQVFIESYGGKYTKFMLSVQNGVGLVGYVKTDYYTIVYSKRIESKSNFISQYFSVRDTTFLLLVSKSNDISEFTNNQYEKIFEKAKIQPEESLWENLYLVDNVIWVNQFTQLKTNLEDSEINYEQKEYNALWEGDELNRVIDSDNLFPGFTQLQYEDDKPVREYSTFYPTRILIRNSRENVKKFSAGKIQTHKDFSALSETPISVEFTSKTRPIPLAFVIDDNLNQKKAFEVTLSDLRIKSSCQLAESRGLFLAAMHLNSEWVEISGESEPFKEENEGYVWDKEKLSNWPKIELYVNLKSYLAETTIKLMLTDSKGNSLGFGTLKITLNNIESSKLNSVSLYKNGHNVATIKIRVEFEFKSNLRVVHI